MLARPRVRGRLLLATFGQGGLPDMDRPCLDLPLRSHLLILAKITKS